MVAVVFAVMSVTAILSFLMGFGINTRIQIRDRLREYGIDKGVAKRYRKAAKILNDLVHVNDLDELMPVLPTAMQKRIEEWNTAHREAINNGK